MSDKRLHPLWASVFGAWFANEVFDVGYRRGQGYSQELYDRVFEEATEVADEAYKRAFPDGVEGQAPS